MRRLILSTGWAIVILSMLKGQEKTDFQTIHTGTYRMYLAGEWDSLIAMGKQALDQETDYYYLRIRMGIACYSKENYMKAAGHFQKALDFNPADPVTLEYLYYARLFSGQPEQAGLVRKQFRGDLALRLPPDKGKAVDRLGVEYLFSSNINGELLSDPEALFSDLPPGVQYVTRRFSNASLSLSHRIAPGFSLAHAYNYLTKYNHLYYFDGLNELQVSDQHVYQHQYYISPAFTTRSGYAFRPMFHLVSVHFQVVDLQGSQGGGNQPAMVYRDSLDIAAGFAFSKGIGSLDLYLGAYYATLNSAQQVQNRLGITWFPFGNLNLYAGAYLNSQYEMSAGKNSLRFIPEMLVGMAMAGKVWLDLNVSLGEMVNYLEYNGLIIFNSFEDVVRGKVTGTLSVPVNEKGSLLYLGGRWTSNRSEFYPFDPAQTQVINPVSYQTISIYGGITWKF
jgi:tetratricopeptide (TPR) repeat protein